MTISSIGRRVALVGSLAMLVALLPLAASAQPTGPVLRDLQVNEELEASESVQASILWSQEAFADDSADEVLIATDADFADALASGVLQGDAPLLYTDGDSVDDLVLEEIERLGATSATILGGEVAVSSDVEDALTDAGLEVSRLEGESRIETAVAIAEQELEGDTVFLARAFGTETDPTQAFADNLALGGWAADSGIPVLLTQTDVLTGNTRAFLEANTDVTNVTVVGGEAAISEDVVAELEELGLTVERVEGENRFGTAVAIAEARGLAAADVDQAVFVEGQADDAYINGLAAAAYSAANDAPILLTNGDAVPPETQDYLGDEADFSITDEPGETAGVLGTNVSADAAQALADALGAELETVQLAGPEPEEPANAGIVIDTDAPGGTFYEFQPEDGSPAITVTYTADDTYTIDGTPATMAAFDAVLTIGDHITYTEENEDGEQTHDLVNQEPVEEGTVGFVDTSSTSFQIIEPVSGAIIGVGPVDYNADCDLYTVDGSAVTEAIFEDNLSIGDNYTFDVAGVAPATVQTCNLENGSVTGSIQSVDVFSTVSPFEAEFEIGNLGDVYDNTIAGANGPSDADAVFYVEENVADQEFVVDGEVSDVETFVNDLSEGDEATYSRVNGIETFTLVNQAPSTVSGQNTETSTTAGGGGTLVIATENGLATETYAGDPDTRFIVNGFIALESDFETALTPGDQVSYTPADGAAGTPETVSLTDAPVAGPLADINTGATTFDVVSANGTDLLVDDLNYATQDFGTGSIRYFVDGTEVNLTAFNTALDDLDADAGSIAINITALAAEYRLDTSASE